MTESISDSRLFRVLEDLDNSRAMSRGVGVSVETRRRRILPAGTCSSVIVPVGAGGSIVGAKVCATGCVRGALGHPALGAPWQGDGFRRFHSRLAAIWRHVLQWLHGGLCLRRRGLDFLGRSLLFRGRGMSLTTGGLSSAPAGFSTVAVGL